MTPHTEEEAIAVDSGARRSGRTWRIHALPRFNELAVSTGAVVGVSARWFISTLSHQHVPATFPSGTLLINLLGCLGIGVLQTLFLERRVIRRELHLGLVVGLLGGFTTFSTFSVETAQLIQSGHAGRALVYQLVSLAGGLFMVFLGRGLADQGHRQWVRRHGKAGV